VAITAVARGRLLRRTARATVTLEDAATTRVLAVHTVKADGRPRDFDLVSAGALRWRAAGYNRVWQRGTVSEPAPVEPSQ
jgi:hypothetical protein